MKEAEKEGGSEREKRGIKKAKEKCSLYLSLCLFAHRLMSTLTFSCAKAQKNKSGRNYSGDEMQEVEGKSFSSIV